MEDWNVLGALEAVLHQTTNAVIVYDRNRVIRKANDAAERMFGFGPGRLEGVTCQTAFGCSSCEKNCGMALGLEDPLTDRRSSAHIHYENGQERFALMHTTPIVDSEGNASGAVAILHSVTERNVPAKRYEVVAESPRSRELIQFVRRVAASEASTILLEGENGTGKDLLARTIHHHSARQAGPFIAINCAAVPETLIESELFGYERGAFTDARQQKRGLFELADKGTLFLDEIGEIPMVLQVKLLRALEERTFRRLGGLKDIEIDVRLVAATNRNLREAVKEGAFRQDLYFRLNVIHVDIPPLRERREDILPMTQFFIDQYNRKFKRHIEGMTPQAERALLAHEWPGNVRELRNAIERAMILEEGPLITLATLPVLPARESPLADAPPPVIPPNGLSLEEHERQLLEQALSRTSGNQTQAARLLSITRDTLRYKIKKFGLRT